MRLLTHTCSAALWDEIRRENIKFDVELQVKKLYTQRVLKEKVENKKTAVYI
jgi:hypothetical protein